MLNGGRERMELKKLKKLGWSTCTYWRSATGNALEGQGYESRITIKSFFWVLIDLIVEFLGEDLSRINVCLL